VALRCGRRLNLQPRSGVVHRAIALLKVPARVLRAIRDCTTVGLREPDEHHDEQGGERSDESHARA
jgi:hypothetical protein